MAHELPRDTENNPDHSEILLDFLSAVLCQHFPIILKILLLFMTSQWRHTIASPVRVLCLLGRARIGIFSKITRFVHQVHTIIDLLSHGFVVIFGCPLRCMIKIFWGEGVVTPSNPPPLYEQLLPLPTSCFRCFCKDPLMTPHPHQPTSSILHCYPIPIHPPPLKSLIIHKVIKNSLTF